MDAELDHQARQLIDAALRETGCPSEVSERGMQRLMQSLAAPISAPPVPPALDEGPSASALSKVLGVAGRTALVALFAGVGMGAAHWFGGVENESAPVAPQHISPSLVAAGPSASAQPIPLPEHSSATDVPSKRAQAKPTTRNQRKHHGKRRGIRRRPVSPIPDNTPAPQQTRPIDEAEPTPELDLTRKLDGDAESQPLEDPSWKAVPRVLQQSSTAEAPANRGKDQDIRGDRPRLEEANLRGPGTAKAGRGHDLLAESRRLRRAQDAVDNLKFARALRLVKNYRQRFPQAQLYGEALAIEALSLCALGRVDEGRRRVAELHRSYPAAPQLARVRRACRPR